MKPLLASFFALLMSQTAANAEIVRFQTADGVTVTADFEKPDGAYSAVIVLFHMAGSSRGEYVDIAEKLNDLGYATLAVDQRSGGSSHGVQNETVAAAGGSTNFIDTIPDLLAASAWAHQNSGAQSVGVLGSSYSAGLVLVLAAAHPTFADAVMSFSPGEYYGSGDYVAKEVGKIDVPVFLSSARNEVGQWQPYADRITSPVVGFIPQGAGRHGAGSLESRDAAEYLAALEAFLGRYLPANS